MNRNWKNHGIRDIDLMSLESAVIASHDLVVALAVTRGIICQRTEHQGRSKRRSRPPSVGRVGSEVRHTAQIKSVYFFKKYRNDIVQG